MVLRRNRADETTPDLQGAQVSAEIEIARLSIERALNREILERMSEGVLVVDEQLAPVLANRAARGLLELVEGDLSPEPLQDELLSIAGRVVNEGRDVTEVVELLDPNRTSVRVSASHLGEQGGAVLVFHDISEEQRAQRMRRQFVTHASHELKTPVAGIQALAEAVRDAAVNDPERAQQFAERVVQEAERLSKLVGDLLDLSRVEDPATVSHASADVSEVVVHEVKDAERLAESKRISLTAAVAPSVRVKGDAEQLGLMVRNLLENAIRYTEEDGNVFVEVIAQGGEATITVADDGIGIPLRHQGRVFERFYRVDKGRSREKGGTGLGLAIVKHVADLHGGRVELKSDLGEGSSFIVHIPALDAPLDGSETRAP